MRKLTTLILGAALVLGTVGMGLAVEPPKAAAPAPADKTKSATRRHKRSKKASHAAVKTPVTPTAPATPNK
jgi:hypothetical protein